jgi:taurine dioxygenase
MPSIKRITGFIGAEISDLRLDGDIAEEAAVFLRSKLAKHHVLVLRDQHLSIEQQKEVTKVFGPLMRLPYVLPMESDPDVIAVLKEADEVNVGVFGGDWHSDFSFLENPPAGSILSAVEIPEVGGDTVWANQAAAYRSLPTHLGEFVDSHRAVHVGKPYGVKYAPPQREQSSASIKMSRGDPNADRETLHPSVITEPTTGEKALFLNPIYVTKFEGLTETESAPFLDQLYKHCTRPDISCRHRWQAGDLVIWDNRMTMHYATNDYDRSRRLLYRTTFERDIPR